MATLEPTPWLVLPLRRGERTSGQDAARAPPQASRNFFSLPTWDRRCTRLTHAHADVPLSPPTNGHAALSPQLVIEEGGVVLPQPVFGILVWAAGPELSSRVCDAGGGNNGAACAQPAQHESMVCGTLCVRRGSAVLTQPDRQTRTEAVALFPPAVYLLFTAVHGCKETVDLCCSR